MFWTYLDMYFKRIATDKKAYFRQTHVVISQAEHVINSQELSPVSCSVQTYMAFSFKNSAELGRASLQPTQNLKMRKG